VVSERFVIGIDDTDDENGRDTSTLARAWAAAIEDEGFGVTHGVTRHHLWPSPKVKATGQNRALAIAVETERTVLDLEDHVVDFVREHASSKANPAIGILSRHTDMPHALAWGRRAQQELLKLSDAERYATESNVLLRGLGGNRNGMIGALAAAGLHAGGKDGLFIQLAGIRELEGRVTAGQIRERTALEHVIDEDTGEELDRDDQVDTGNWVRPRMIVDEPVLLTRRSPDEKKLWLTVDRRPAS
jgi:tRNA(Ile2) C34 agmatinyltransferase TiaS